MLSDQPYRRQKTLTAGDLFPTPTIPFRCARRRSSSFLKAPEGEISATCRPRAFLLQQLESHASAREGTWSTFRPRASTSSLAWRHLATLHLCLCHPSPENSGTSDHISGNKDLFSSITTTFALPTVTLANGSQTMAKGPEYGEDNWHRRESQGLYHLTAPSTPAVCISTDAPFLIHSRLGHPSLFKFQKMVPSFHLCRHLRSPQNASSWDIPDFKRVIVVIPLRLIATFSPLIAFSPTSGYHRRHRVPIPPSLAEVPADSLPIPSASPAPALPPSADLPIALRKAEEHTGSIQGYKP
ncbi:hypothetical protein CK203_020540 [Vitis vinifera]|uniref:GAG-pre-integrase domain-containing protein n=1 Tax=Vitis vinifera TaxID=29760 RepID=A0A438FM87_VITVI|nr:hypothetical protein CK203_020540 [Vitis vinifera]